MTIIDRIELFEGGKGRMKTCTELPSWDRIETNSQAKIELIIIDIIDRIDLFVG